MAKKYGFEVKTSKGTTPFWYNTEKERDRELSKWQQNPLIISVNKKNR